MMHLKEEIGRYRHEIIINDGSYDFIKDNIINIFIDKVEVYSGVARYINNQRNFISFKDDKNIERSFRKYSTYSLA